MLDEELFLKITSDKLLENNLRLVFAALMLLLRAALRQPTLKSEVTIYLGVLVHDIPLRTGLRG